MDLTSLDHVPGGKTEKYLGNLDFFFIRESTGIREVGGEPGKPSRLSRTKARLRNACRARETSLVRGMVTHSYVTVPPSQTDVFTAS